jgi:DNA (cytosine-5)-methyltransferase 1
MEQVPGLFSSNGPEDFRRVLLEFLALRPDSIGWRVFDTQWFGPPQRRERIFFVLDFGGFCASEILSLAQSVCGDSPPRREKGQGTPTGVANCLGASSGDTDPDIDTYIPEVAGTFQANNGGGGRGSNVDDAAHGYMIPDVCATLNLPGGGADDMNRLGAVIPVQQAFTVREDATAPNGGNLHAKEPDVALTIGAMQPGEQSHHAQVFVAEAVADPICTKEGGTYTHEGSTFRTRNVVLSFPERMSFGGPVDEDVAGTLEAINPKAVTKVQWASGGGKIENDTAQALRSNAETNYQFLHGGFGVRRLTPRECERCQGWPDDWTRWGIDKKGNQVEISDTQRYKVIGNGVSSPVSRWLGKNLLEAVAKENVE